MSPSSQDLMNHSLGSTIQLLPDELLLMILRYVWDRRRDQQVSLSHCSMVCSRWRPLAQSLLFTDVILIYEDDPAIFFLALQSNPAVGQATRILDFKVDPLVPHGLPRTQEPRPRLINEITGHCPRLYHLMVESSVTVEEQVPRTLPKNTFMTLQALSLYFRDDIFGNYNIGLEDVIHFLHQFTSLSHLRLHNLSQLETPDPPRIPPSHPSYELYEFSWIDRDDFEDVFNPDAFSYVVDRLFENPSKGPRVLELFEYDAQSQVDIFIAFVRRFGKGLTSIRTELLGFELDSLPLNLSELCPNLRELILPNILSLSPLLRASFEFTHLEHLGCGEEGMQSLRGEKLTEEFIDWVMSLPNIRTVTVYLDCIEIDPEYFMIKMWKQRCISSVQLRFLSNHESSTEEEDLVKTPYFPRSKTLGNLSHMTIPSRYTTP